ncbi:hypothetical protein GCM10023335_53700 [Streptomyces siamensis]|uniref:Uncharacterized protein n=1 Tax=Streptomyces siamensis TaxID=1274986 RepID=A0ABP9J6C1_9ACTN
MAADLVAVPAEALAVGDGERLRGEPHEDHGSASAADRDGLFPHGRYTGEVEGHVQAAAARGPEHRLGQARVGRVQARSAPKARARSRALGNGSMAMTGAAPAG